MSFAADPVYNDVIRQYFADTPVIGQEVWERYSQYITPWLQSNPTFDQFLEMYIQKPGSLASLSNVTALPSAPYTTYLNAYVSDRTAAERLDIWRAFLASKGYTAAPTAAEINSKSLQDDFGYFVYNISNTQNATIQSLKEFASQYNAFGFSRQSLQLDQVTTIPEGFYSDYLNSFFGGTSQIQLLDTWRSFLVSIGYPKKDLESGQIIYAPSQEDLGSPAMKAAFARQVDALRSKELFFATETSVSPQRIAIGTILDSLMGSLRNMLDTTEMLVRNQANALIVSGKIQQEYSTMLSRVPTLTPGKPLNITVPSLSDLETGKWPLTDFILGYNRISLEDVVEWGIETALKAPDTAADWDLQTTDPTNNNSPVNLGLNFLIEPGNNQAATYLPTLDAASWDALYTIMQNSFASSTAITLDSDLAQDILRAFVVVRGKALGVTPESLDMTLDSNITAFTNYVTSLPHTDQAVLTDTLAADAGASKATVTFTYNDDQYSLSFTTHDQNGVPLSRSELYTKAGDLLKAIFAQNTTAIASLQNCPGIPGRYLLSPGPGDTPEQEKDAQDDLKARNEQNAILQQYVENIRARRDATKTASQNMQAAAQATKDNINEQTSLWTSILETINDVIKSIFK